MGVLNRGILGGFRGSVGPVTGTSWKGIDVMKSKPLSVANPNTPAQVSQRSKFRGVVALASLWLAVLVKPLWDRFAQRQSGFNVFVSSNIDNFDSSGDLSTPADLVISEGSWALAGLSNFAVDSAFELISFDVSNAIGLPTDEIICGLYNQTDDLYLPAVNVGVRSDVNFAFGTSVIPLAGKTYRIWVAARRADGTAVSNTETATAVAS